MRMRKAVNLRGQRLLEQVRNTRPLIHCITNYVTANDVANIILAAGGSPVMADNIREVKDITRAAKALVLNIGTLQEATVASMLAAGKLAADLGHPVVFDPVGAGASACRTETALQIVRQVSCTAIRGNASEIRTLIRGMEDGQKTTAQKPTAQKPATYKPEEAVTHTHGVDADEREILSDENRESTIATLRRLSLTTGAILIMTGATDLIVDGERCCLIQNGHPQMAGITGTGCMLDGVLAAFLAVCAKEERFLGAAYAVAAHGICGELASVRTAAAEGGSGSFRQYFLDAMSRLDDETIGRNLRYEV